MQLFGMEQGTEERLMPSSRLTLPHCPLDLTFDPQGRLWVLLDSRETPFLVYTHTQDSWQVLLFVDNTVVPSKLISHNSILFLFSKQTHQGLCFIPYVATGVFCSLSLSLCSATVKAQS